MVLFYQAISFDSLKPYLLQANLANANLEGALATGNTSFRGSNITGAGMYSRTQLTAVLISHAPLFLRGNDACDAIF